jgi:hypothetical protein
LPPGLLRFGLRGNKEGAFGILPKLMDQAAEAAWGVAEACGSLRGAKSFDEIGTQRFILTVIALGRLEEVVREC